jgi:glutaredoxin
MAQVVIYTSPFCIPCEEARRYLTSAGVAFELVDVLMDEDVQDMLEERGLFSTPVISIDGEFIDGFNRARVDELLGLTTG